ncbi:hypothetical protein H9P43_003601 [Blastocladiella emersonii ATCC 22665]|nr:hypothetical protein H9P43_003601 [Blastocladiella emersonii ATCC 22665]
MHPPVADNTMIAVPKPDTHNNGTTTKATGIAAECLDKHSAGWSALTGNGFLKALRDGSLPDTMFNRWLMQDYLFVVEFTKLMGELFALAPRRDVPTLFSGFAAVRDEVAWFESHLARLAANGVQHVGVPSPDFVSVSTTPAELRGTPIAPLPACAEFIQFLADLRSRARTLAAGGDSAHAYRILLVVFWAMEHAYASAWGTLRGDQMVPQRYREFVDRWTVPEFEQYVTDLAKASDVAYAGASEEQRREALELVEAVVKHEDAFWAMVQH